MSYITLEEAKAYLRVDSDFDDSLITSLLASSGMICRDVARLSPEEWDNVISVTSAEEDPVMIRGTPYAAAAVLQMKEVLRVSVLYTLGYLFEHREEADHHDLVLTLRSLLFAIREGVF